VALPFSRRAEVVGSSDPRAYIAGNIRNPDGSCGPEIRVADTRVKINIGGNSSGKTAGVILRNALQRTGVSQVFVDTRCQAGAVSAPWRRTVDHDVLVANDYGALGHLPAYADLQGGGGINLLEAPELDPANPLATDHLMVMGTTVFPAENTHQPHFPLAAQGLFTGFAYGELVEAKREGRKPLLANVRAKVLERSEYDRKTGEPVKGMAWHARQICALGNPVVRSCLERFTGPMDDEMRSVIGTFEANSRFMASPALSAGEQRGRMDFGALGQRVSSLYLAVPAEHVDGCAPWFRLAISGAMRPLFAPHPIAVSFWLDEFYALKRIPLVDQIGVVAGSKIEIIIVVQSLSMLKQLYGDAFEAFVGNASVISLIGSPGDQFTCDYLVKRSGEKTVVQPHSGWSVNGGAGGMGTSGGGGFHTLPTLSHADLYNLPPGVGFIWLHGLADPVPAVFPGYYTDPVLSRRARRDPYVRW
jgi:type IV secretory pathway TraG/TraD family ATPase VirD4